jgi:hypothetical protein
MQLQLVISSLPVHPARVLHFVPRNNIAPVRTKDLSCLDLGEYCRWYLNWVGMTRGLSKLSPRDVVGTWGVCRALHDRRSTSVSVMDILGRAGKN